MTTGERLVSISTLSTGTALDHFLNISTGSGGETIFVTKLFADVKKTTVVGIVKETSLVKGGVIEKTVIGTVSTTNTTGEITSSNLTGKL